MEVRRVNRKEVDYKKWDKAVEDAVNSFPYGYSWYLNAVSEDWDAIIVNDYEYILPLPFERILGAIKYYKHPILIQQLGPFGKQIPDNQTLNAILEKLPLKAIRLNLNFAENISFSKKHSFLNPVPRINQTISLEEDLETIEKRFTNNPRRAIQSKLKNFGELEQVNNPKLVLDFVYGLKGKAMGFNKTQYNKALQLFLTAKEKESIQFFQLKNINTNKIVVMGALLIGSDRIINFFYTSIKGTENYGAASIYIYKLIKKFKTNKKILDLDGSEIPGINQFFSSFGSQTSYYTSIDKMHPVLKLIYKAKVYLRTRKIKR